MLYRKISNDSNCVTKNLIVVSLYSDEHKEHIQLARGVTYVTLYVTYIAFLRVTCSGKLLYMKPRLHFCREKFVHITDECIVEHFAFRIRKKCCMLQIVSLTVIMNV